MTNGTHETETAQAVANPVNAIVMCQVDEGALRKVLEALMGEPHYIREIQATRSLPDNPLNILIDNYNDWIVKLNEE